MITRLQDCFRHPPSPPAEAGQASAEAGSPLQSEFAEACKLITYRFFILNWSILEALWLFNSSMPGAGAWPFIAFWTKLSNAVYLRKAPL